MHKALAQIEFLSCSGPPASGVKAPVQPHIETLGYEDPDWPDRLPALAAAKDFMRFVYTFSRQVAHVLMKAPMPSPMKPADDRLQVLFREALREGRKGGMTAVKFQEKYDENTI